MTRRSRSSPKVVAQGRLWPRLNRSNGERALRYNNLRAFGYSRKDAIKLRDLNDKRYFRLIERARYRQEHAR